MTAPRSRLGRVSTWLARLSVLAVIIGPTIAHFELVRPLVGFAVFGVGLLCSLLSILLGLVAIALGPEGTRGATGGGMLAAVIARPAVFVASGAGPHYHVT